jgi:hypothetical protein
MANALVHMDAVKLNPDELEMLQTNYAEHISAMKNFVFIPEEDEDAIFSKRSMSEFLGNAGFALGTMAGVTTELVADALITLATGGAGAATFGATAARLIGKSAAKKIGKEAVEQTAKQAAKKGNFFTGMLLADESIDVIKTVDNIKKVNHLNQNRTIGREMKKAFSEIYGFNIKAAMNSEGFMNKAWELTKGIPLAGTTLKYGEKVVAAAKAGRGFGEASGIAFKGLRRLGQEFNLASTEASFEAVSTYGATLEQMINQHIEETGREVDVPTLMKMKELAGEAAFSNYGTNMAILLASNKITFGAMFNKMGPAGKFAAEMLEESSDVGKRYVTRTFGKNMKNVLQAKAYDTRGFFGMYGQLGQVWKDFGKKQALLEFGKTFGRGVGKFEITEGLQENMQEMSNSAWQKYYSGRINGTATTLNKAFEEGLAEQFTAQGFRTFLQGALTGSLIRPVTHTIGYASQKLNEKSIGSAYEAQGKANPFKEASDRHDMNIKTFNTFAEHIANSNQNANNYVNFVEGLKESMNITEASAEGKDYDFVNARDNMMIKAAVIANQTNNIDAFLHVLKNMGETMTQDEFETAFNVKLADTKYENVADFTQSVGQRIKDYSEEVDKIRKATKGKLVDPDKYEEGTMDYVSAVLTRQVQEDAVQMLALNKLKAGRAAERSKKVFEDYNSIESLANSSDYMYRILTNPENLQSELSNIQADLKLLKESLSTEGLEQKEVDRINKEIGLKQQELILLSEWVNYWNSTDNIVDVKGEDGELKKEIHGKKLDQFMGVRSKEKVKFKEKDGTETEEYLFNKKDYAVKETFRKLINLKNLQQGIDARVSREDIDSGMDKIVDFITLEKDARDYMEGAESLSSPEAYRQTVKRMKDGKYKAYLLDLANNLENNIVWAIADVLKINGQIEIFTDKKGETRIKFLGDMTPQEWEALREKAIDAIIESDPYKNLMKIIITKELGTEQIEYAKKQMDAIDELIKTTLKENVGKYAPDHQWDEVITEEDYKKFEEDNKDVDEKILQAIAERLANTESGTDGLTKRQTEIYKARTGTIDSMVDAIKAEKIKDQPKPGLAYSIKNTSTGMFTVKDKYGNIVQENVSEEDANKKVDEINKKETAAKLILLGEAVSNAITYTQENAEEGEPFAGYYTRFEFDGQTLFIEGNSVQEVHGKLQRLSEQLATALGNSEDIKLSEIDLGPSPATEGTTGEEVEEEDDLDITVPSDDFELKRISLEGDIKIYQALKADGHINDSEGNNVEEKLKSLITELKELLNDNLSPGETSSEEVNEDEETITEQQVMKELIAEMIAPHFALPSSPLNLEEMLNEEEMKFYKENMSEIHNLAKEMASKMVDEDVSEEILHDQFYDDLSKNGWSGSGIRKDIRIKDGENGSVYIEYNDKDNTYRVLSYKYEVSEKGETIDAGFASPSGANINLGKQRDMESKIEKTVSRDKVLDTVAEVAEANGLTGITEEQETDINVTKDGPIEVRDENGVTIGYVETPEQAEELLQRMEQNATNLKFTETLLKEFASKKNKKGGRFKNETIKGLYTELNSAMEEYNASKKKKKFTSLEAFYKSGKGNRNTVIKTIDNFIGVDPELIKKDGVVDSSKVVNSKKKKTNSQPAADTKKDTKSAQFKKAVTKLHNELKDLSMPSTVEKTGQIAVVFPDQTTDFTKFVDTSAEGIAIDALKDIKISCTK